MNDCEIVEDHYIRSLSQHFSVASSRSVDLTFARAATFTICRDKNVESFIWMREINSSVAVTHVHVQNARVALRQECDWELNRGTESTMKIAEVVREKKPFELSCKIPEATQHLPNPHAGNRNDEKNDRENAEAYVVPLKRAVIRARSRAEPSRPKITSNLVLNAKFATTTHRAKFPFSAAFSPNTNKWIGMKTHSTRLRPRLAGCVNCELCAICGSVIRHQLLVVSSFSAICHCRAYLTNFLFGDFVFSAHLRLTSRLWLFVVSHTRVRMPFVAESDGLFLANKKKLYEIMVDNKKKHVTRKIYGW